MVGQTQRPWVRQNPSSCLTQWNNLDQNEILLKVVLNTINGQVFLFWDFIFKFGSYIVFCVVLLCVSTFWVPCCVLWCPLRFPHGGDVQFVFVYSCLACLCFVAYSGVQHILCCVFVLFCLRLVYPVSLDCQLLIASSVFSNIYEIYGMPLVKLNSIPIFC